MYGGLNGKNRFYSTYYIKSDEEKKMLPIGLIIDSSYANIHRNDLGDNQKSIDEAYKKIRDTILELYSCMCSQKITSLECLIEISSIFHSIIYRYLDVDQERYSESPFKLEYLDNQYLPKIIGNSGVDIVIHKPKENYQVPTPLDQDSVTALTAIYFKFIEKNNVIDYDTLTQSPDCINGITQVYKRIQDGPNTDNYKKARRILHFFPGVDEYITYVISGEYREEPFLSDSEIDYWLCSLKRKLGKKYRQELYLKLIGRYGLNSALMFDGSVRKADLSFKDYIFNGVPELKDGCFSNWQNEQYDKMYSLLKCQLLENRLIDPGNERNKYMIRYMIPEGKSKRGWDYFTYDCFYYSYYKQGNPTVSEDHKFLLLEKIALDSHLRESIRFRDMTLFEKWPVNLECREGRFFKYYRTREQQMIDISFLRAIKTNSFETFLQAVSYRKGIRDNCGEIRIGITCHQPSISTSEIISGFLSKLVKIKENEKKAYLLSEYDSNDVLIDDVQESTNNELPEENRSFIHQISGYNLHLYRFDSGSKKHMVAYFGNHSAAIKTAAGESFKAIADFRSRTNDVFVFYDNVPDPQSVIAIVLNELHISKDLLELLLGYIHNGNNTKTMNYLSRRRVFAKVRKKLVWEWSDISQNEVPEINDIEIIYRLLTARGSYDIYCPICTDIPLEVFNYGEDTKKSHSRKLIVMENENPDTKSDYPYIITVACSYCFEKLRNSLLKSVFDGKNILLTTQIAHGQHERMKSRHQIELSPLNILLMKKINLKKIIR